MNSLSSVAAIVLLLAITDSAALHSEPTSSLDDSGCLPWSYRHSLNSTCQCGSTLNGKIKCNITTTTLVLPYYLCMTYDPTADKTVAGYCPCEKSQYEHYRLTMTKTDFNNFTCGVFSRNGELCSQCKQKHGIPLHSYYCGCVSCEKFNVKNLFKFLTVSLPLPAIMCIVVILFHLNTLCPPWGVFVLMAQVLSAPPILEASLTYAKTIGYHRGTILYTIAAAFYGPWNLDFFRGLYNSECISPSITNLQAAIIEGSVGVYPLAQLIVLYSLINLRDRGCSIVVTIWKPFHFLLSRFRSRLSL